MDKRHTPAAEANQYLHDRVADSVRERIREGTLQPGERAPSLRDTSQRFGVSMATTMRAYGSLEDEGWLVARRRSGFYVAAVLGREAAAPTGGRPSGEPGRLDLRGLSKTLIRHNGGTPDMASLALALPPTDLLPAKGLQRAWQRAQRAAPQAALDYTFPPGLEALRRQITDRVALAGARAHHDDVFITTGCMEALHMALASVANAGDTIAVESPTFFNVLCLIEALGMRALELPTDPQTGIDPDALETALRDGRIQAALLIPSFSNPLGSCLPEPQRERIAGLASRYRTPIIEDDIYGDLHFGPERPKLLRAFDTDGYILTASSFSKTIAPGYRIGWLLPGRYAESASLRLNATTLAAATPAQMAVAEYLSHGAYTRHLKRLRRTYRERTRQMRRAIAARFPSGTRISDPAGGFVLWVELPAGTDGIAVYKRALGEGIRTAPGRLFATTGCYDGNLRLSCGMPWSQALDHALTRLGAIVTESR